MESSRPGRESNATLTFVKFGAARVDAEVWYAEQRAEYLMLAIALANSCQLAEVLAWLEREQLDTYEGFYCNRDIIVQAFADAEMICATFQQSVIGFVIQTLKSTSSSIDILEIHPAFRGRGYGTQLVLYATERLFERGATFVTVNCAPRSSESFWRLLGFLSISPSHPLELTLRKRT